MGGGVPRDAPQGVLGQAGAWVGCGWGAAGGVGGWGAVANPYPDVGCGPRLRLLASPRPPKPAHVPRGKVLPQHGTHKSPPLAPGRAFTASWLRKRGINPWYFPCISPAWCPREDLCCVSGFSGHPIHSRWGRGGRGEPWSTQLCPGVGFQAPGCGMRSQTPLGGSGLELGCWLGEKIPKYLAWGGREHKCDFIPMPYHLPGLRSTEGFNIYLKFAEAAALVSPGSAAKPDEDVPPCPPAPSPSPAPCSQSFRPSVHWFPAGSQFSLTNGSCRHHRDGADVEHPWGWVTWS